MNPFPDLALEAGSFVRPDGGATRGRRRAGVRDHSSEQDGLAEVILIPPGGIFRSREHLYMVNCES